MQRKALFVAAVLWAVLALFSVVTIVAWAMPYVPQTIGIYDTLYERLDTDRCRQCHGANTSDRHHMLGYGCGSCHGFETPRDCSLCHEKGQVTISTGSAVRGHHVADIAATGQCTLCHNPQYVADPDGANVSTGPITSTTPNPDNCRGCHKDSPDPPAPGDPDPPIFGMEGSGPENLHHNPGGRVVDATSCESCHTQTLPFYDPNQIRICERCHPAARLHSAHADLGTAACQACHGQQSQMVRINNAYTTDGSGNPRTAFTPGAAIQYHFDYDVVGDAAKAYKVKAEVTAFGLLLAAKESRYPGTGYQMMVPGTVKATALPGAVKNIVMKLKLKYAGVLLDKDKRTVQITIVSP